jgi:hypothetical protein
MAARGVAVDVSALARAGGTPVCDSDAERSSPLFPLFAETRAE